MLGGGPFPGSICAAPRRGGKGGRRGALPGPPRGLRAGAGRGRAPRRDGGARRNAARCPHLVVFPRFLFTAVKRRRALYREGSAAKTPNLSSPRAVFCFRSPFSLALLEEDRTNEVKVN